MAITWDAAEFRRLMANGEIDLMNVFVSKFANAAMRYVAPDKEAQRLHNIVLELAASCIDGFVEDYAEHNDLTTSPKERAHLITLQACASALRDAKIEND